eukprot:418825-Rhodomonas_salina.2
MGRRMTGIGADHSCVSRQRDAGLSNRQCRTTSRGASFPPPQAFLPHFSTRLRFSSRLLNSTVAKSTNSTSHKPRLVLDPGDGVGDDDLRWLRRRQSKHGWSSRSTALTRTCSG